MNEASQPKAWHISEVWKMNTRIVGRVLWVLSVLGLLSVSLAHAVMPLPNGSEFYAYTSSELPVVNANPSQAKPIGVGDVASAHDLALRIGLDSFSAPVDIYLAIHAPSVFPDFFLFRADGSLAPASSGLSPWKAATTGPVSESLLGTIPMSLIPSGDYAFYLLAAPAGAQPASIFANCYLWVTSVGNLRVLDVSEKAASLFGGDVQGAAAILMALGRDYEIENVAKAALGGSLTQYGEILAAASAIRASASGQTLPSFCDPNFTLEECREDLFDLFYALEARLKEATNDPFRKGVENRFEEMVTVYTLYLGILGYSGKQIKEAIYGTFFGGGTRIELAGDGEHPFGGIIYNSVDPDCIFVKPAKQPHMGVFSDLGVSDQEKNDIPGTEGMTFPAYYKGTGTVRIYKSQRNWGPFQCTLNDVVFVARVGGMGGLERTLEVFTNKTVGISYSGECYINIPVQGSLWPTITGEYTLDGIHHNVTEINTTNYNYTHRAYNESDVKFNKQVLWGNVYDESSIPEWDSFQEIEWDFRLEEVTEAEFRAVYPNY
jgi:hypothetical protein